MIKCHLILPVEPGALYKDNSKANNARHTGSRAKNSLAQLSSRLRGFTLIELLFTIVIASILMAVAFPAMRNFIMDNRLTAQANAFVQGVRSARAEAIKRRADIDFSKKAGGWTDGWEIQDNNTGGGGVLKHAENQAGITSANATATKITFRGTGVRTLTTNFIMRYCDDRNKGRKITIKGLMGLSKVCWIGYPGRPENCSSGNSC